MARWWGLGGRLGDSPQQLQPPLRPAPRRRKACVSNFKGKYLLDIREYYEKEGKLLPGFKGISLPPDQWDKLYAGLEQLRAALQQAGGA